MEDVAIVGIGLRFPGNASSPEQLWKVLERGESQWTEFPKDRLNIDGYYHPGGDRQGSISFRGAHFLKGDVAAFDASFFSVSGEDAKAIDPQQRMLLETTFEALENAGIRKEDIDGSDAAVYVGSFVKDYEQVCLRDPDWQPQYAATGNGIAIMANRISYFFNIHGPSMTIDTGCSGSLVSVHLAAQSLRAGETSLAIAAGAGLILTPNTIMPMTALNFLSPDGKCFTFDSRANGYGRGEGVGVVIMKRLADALRDNDTIRAVIRGTKVNQDGHTTGITLPSKEAQVANIRSLYESVGLDFNQTAYVECHGTGTQAGDWRELKAISESLGSVRSTDNPIIVGSVKPNIGHLEGAAGVAGLIKGILTLEHGQIPPNINFETGNPDIHFKEWNIKVPLKMMDWPLPGLRRVSVNCFGFGGTNAHVILDEAPRYLAARGLMGHHNSMEASSPVHEDQHANFASKFRFSQPQIFCYSSNEKAGVRRIMKSQVKYLTSKEDTSSTDLLLKDYAYTLGCRRSEMEWKHAVVATSPQDLISKLENCNESSFSRSSKGKTPRVCFIFCGQGAQYPGMGRDLLAFEPFRRSLQTAAIFMRKALRSPFNLIDEIYNASDKSRISNPAISQPATTALQIALIDLLDSFNIKPMYVVGHSSGEVAAAFAAGALSREAAWEVAYYRGLASSRVSLKAPGLEGGMMVIGLPLQEAERYLQGMNDKLEVACVNSPRSTTVSGSAKAIRRLADDLSGLKVFHRALPVKVAYHSSHMRLVEDEYSAMIDHIRLNETQGAKMISTVTGELVSNSDLDARYWSDNLVSPVRYLDAITALVKLPAEDRPTMIIELSPSGALRSPTSDILSDIIPNNAPIYYSAMTGRGNDVTSLLDVVGQVWAHGCPVSMGEVISKGDRQAQLKCLADLPPYPWFHDKSYWHESHLGRANRFRKFGRQDLIGAPTADAISFEPRWRGFLRISENPWIQDHQVQKAIVYPAAGMVAMALEGASQLVEDNSDLFGYEITNMRFDKAMLIQNTTHGLETAMNFKRTPDSRKSQSKNSVFHFSIYSKHLDGPWEQHARGSIQIRYKGDNAEAMFGSLQTKYESLRKSCSELVKPRQLYELLDIVGMNYGPLFQNITRIVKGDNSCVIRTRIPDTKSKMPAKFEYPHLIHPATLDSMFQTLFAIDNKPMVPTYIESLFVSAAISTSLEDEFRGFATAHRKSLMEVSADISMTQSDWKTPSVVIRGMQFTTLGDPSPGTSAFLPSHRNLCTEIVWAEDHTFTSSRDVREIIRLMAHKYGGLSILQAGGSYDLTRDILAICTPNPRQVPWLSRYTIAAGNSCDAEIFSKTRGTIHEPFIERRAFDNPADLPKYDIILVMEDHSVGPLGYIAHLKPTGLLEDIDCNSRLEKPYSDNSHYYEAGRRWTYAATLYRHSTPPPTILAHGIIVLLPNNAPLTIIRLAANIRDNMVGLYAAPLMTMYADEIPQNLETIASNTVISLLDFSDNYKARPFIFNASQKDFETFHALQKSAKKILWITQAAHMKPHDPKGAPFMGLARTLMSEDPLKSIITLDLGSGTQLYDVSTAKTIIRVLNHIVSDRRDTSPPDMEYAEEGGRIFIPRIVPIDSLNDFVETDQSNNTVGAPFRLSMTQLKLEVNEPSLDLGNYAFVESIQPSPQHGEIGLNFHCAFINTYDLDTFQGRSTESAIGLDFIGIVKQIGDGVSGLAKDDRVAALVSDGAISNRRNVDSRFVTKWSFNLPLNPYVSSYYALRTIGRLRSGKSVLIHAGASSFGIAAVQVASQIGVKIFATVMGSSAPEQRLILEDAGIEKSHILDADSDGFARSILDLTQRGVDVVYNCTQQHIEANFTSVRNGGTIIQFADKSACPHAVCLPNSTTSFITLDLPQLLRDDPDYVAELLDETLKFLDVTQINAALHPRLIQNVELGHLPDGLRKLEKDPYLGCVSVTANCSGDTWVRMKAPSNTKSFQETIDPDGTYVIAGGLGGLGMSICELLVSHGAKNIAFLSRSGASSQTSTAFVENLKKTGVNARVYKVDICDLSTSFSSLMIIRLIMRGEMPPVKGVFQCAAVIKDAVFDNMNYTDWMAAFNPKTKGSHNLVEVFGNIDSDPFFVFLSSSAGIIGGRGQANYAAGNNYMDALARSLRLEGKHAVSIDLGPVLGAGMLTHDEEILDMLRASGFYGIRHQDFITTIKHAVTGEITPSIPMPPQVIMGVGTGGLIRQNKPADPYWTRTALFSYMGLVDMPPDLSITGSASSLDMKSMLASSADTTSAINIICTGLVQMLAKAVNMLPEEIDSSKPPNVYGVDSLVAVGVRNWVISNCGVEISVFEVLSDKTIEELAGVVAAGGGFGLEKN